MTNQSTPVRRYFVGDAPLIGFGLEQLDSLGNSNLVNLTSASIVLHMTPREAGLPTISGACIALDPANGLVGFQINGGVLPSATGPVVSIGVAQGNAFVAPATYDGQISVAFPAGAGGPVPTTSGGQQIVLTTGPFTITVMARS